MGSAKSSIYSAVLAGALTMATCYTPQYDCLDGDGDKHYAYIPGQCATGDDYCDDNASNWTDDGCYECVDQDGDGYGTQCDKGIDCDDENVSQYTDCSETVVPEDIGLETTIVSGPSGTVSNASASFSFSCNVSSCTFECRLDAGAWEACTNPTTLNALSDGAHTFQVRALDPEANVDASPASQSWTIDTTVPDTLPPDTNIDSGPDGTVTGRDATFIFSCTEGVCTYECRLDAGAWEACTSPKTYSILAVTSHTFDVRAYDLAANVDGVPASRSWAILNPAWASIPAGCFNMGDAFTEGDADELPVRTVCLTAFEMITHAVTNGEYQACVTAGQCTAPGNTGSYSGRSPYYGNASYANYPVVYVNYTQSAAYCAWAGGRLPTEAEWEYAARGGLAGKRFPWGDTIDCTAANYYTEDISAYDVDPFVGSKACSGFGTYGDTLPAGTYAANGYGLFDVAGNVWEWTADWYDGSYYAGRPDPDNDPTGPGSGSSRVIRGGEFASLARGTRVASRSDISPAAQYGGVGFRCVR